jgi:hypothetical protein
MGRRLPPRPIARTLQSCGGCDAQLATLAITGWVQKVSNVILNRTVRDAGTGGLPAGASVAGASVDPRRNTPVSRSRALAAPVADRPLPPGAS